MKISRALTLGALLTLCAALSTPDSFAASKGKGHFGWSGLSKVLAPNCTWTCSDGRTGSAEVKTESQCAAACSGACGQTCTAS
jgi:hypothetical protein